MRLKTIGILGGMGPEACADCFSKIIKSTPANRDQDHLHIIVENNPAVPDRTEAILESGESPVPIMAKGCKVLEKAGADFIIMVCNTAHYYKNDIESQISIPILSILDVVANSVKKARPTIEKVGLLATWGTVKAKIYQERLKAEGIHTLIPDEKHQENVMQAIRTIKAAPSLEQRIKANSALKKAAQSLVEKGAGGVIGGCTEIPLALSQDDLNVPFFDSQLLLAKEAVRKAGLEPI